VFAFLGLVFFVFVFVLRFFCFIVGHVFIFDCLVLFFMLSWFSLFVAVLGLCLFFLFFFVILVLGCVLVGRIVFFWLFCCFLLVDFIVRVVG